MDNVSSIIASDNSIYSGIYAQIVQPGKVESSLHVAQIVAAMQHPIAPTEAPPAPTSGTEPAPLTESQRPTRPYALPATEPCAAR